MCVGLHDASRTSFHFHPFAVFNWVGYNDVKQVIALRHIMLEKVLVTYEIVIKTIERDGKYVINTNDPEKITIFEILREFDPLYNWQGNIIEKYE